jgi:hypothetical protein
MNSTHCGEQSSGAKCREVSARHDGKTAWQTGSHWTPRAYLNQASRRPMPLPAMPSVDAALTTLEVPADVASPQLQGFQPRQAPANRTGGIRTSACRLPICHRSWLAGQGSSLGHRLLTLQLSAVLNLLLTASAMLVKALSTALMSQVMALRKLRPPVLTQQHIYCMELQSAQAERRSQQHAADQPGRGARAASRLQPQACEACERLERQRGLPSLAEVDIKGQGN